MAELNPLFNMQLDDVAFSDISEGNVILMLLSKLVERYCCGIVTVGVKFRVTSLS